MTKVRGTARTGCEERGLVCYSEDARNCAISAPPDAVYMPLKSPRLRNRKALAPPLSRNAKVCMNADSKSRDKRQPVLCQLGKGCNKTVMFVKPAEGHERRDTNGVLE